MKPFNQLLTVSAVAATIAITAFAIPSATEQSAPFTEKFWVLESGSIVPAIDVSGDGKPDKDIRAMLEDCELDDAEMYKSGGKVMKHQGKVKCDEEDETTMESGTWKYNAATKQLTIHHYDTEKPQTLIVKEVTATKMVCTYEFTTPKGSKHLITGVFKVK
ncbi:hypothetical protein HHL16_21320 [Pseudoflavitalea sp. G-6-1-2]|uniref:hypothetical protein n=1 Tax=Pseudoflavitalea sp. G-6-1-2 TaxID=2728841 RepID=UPI00146DD221|nr:hypothetical protein [Pseudoflavitalea sp. G-6-1-2]NML23434.1 hypothetical protein [Pseudoflavitalea sp. G-6-1-2]